jgi:hypothetical protein
MTRNILFTAILVVAFGIAIEFAAFVVGRYVITDSLIFDPHFSRAEQTALLEQYEEYLEIRDPVLGWPPTKNKGWQPKRDQFGARLTPDSRKSLTPNGTRKEYCTSAYGDSFTWGAEVGGDESWPYVLSTFLGCPVGNFGVGGYGTDQAYIRYQQNQLDNAKVVFLNHLSENIMRNVGQFRSLVLGYDADRDMRMYKPRYILSREGELQLIELPSIAAQNYIDALINPEDYLPYEYFLPGKNTGQTKLKFPYTLALLGILNHFHIRAAREGKPWYMDFYEPDHPSNGLQVTANILLTFNETAKKRGQAPIVTVIPTGGDLEYFVEHKLWPYQNLIDLLHEHNVDVLNFGPGLMALIGDDDPCSLFNDCSSHFNATGYRYLAEIAYEELAKRNLLSLVTISDSAGAPHTQPES